MALPFGPPVEPMLAKLSRELPDGEGWIYEPKWDGFRALVFKDGDELLVQSRDGRPLGRYFPELVTALIEKLPERVVLDGEIVIARAGALDFEALLLRIHPASSRVSMLARETPASFVAWDLLALGDEDLRERPLEQRRALLEEMFAALPSGGDSGGGSAVLLTPATRDIAVARDWFRRFEGAGLDGVVSKRASQRYVPGERVMVKTKHVRTADCVVAGFRWFKGSRGRLVGSLLLGLYSDDGVLQHAGVCGAFSREKRAELVTLLAPFRLGARDEHPWRAWAEWEGDDGHVDRRLPGASSRWNRGKDLSWEPLRPELVVEVAYDHLQGQRFRHATQLVRFRPDKGPADCRYDQLETTTPHELAAIFSTGSLGPAGSTGVTATAPRPRATGKRGRTRGRAVPGADEARRGRSSG